VCDLLAERAASVLGSVTVASIGPITSKTLRARGIEPDVEAGQYTVAGLLDALEVHFAAPAV
jgi:uroporphyrinogen-III synthase